MGEWGQLNETLLGALWTGHGGVAPPSNRPTPSSCPRLPGWDLPMWSCPVLSCLPQQSGTTPPLALHADRLEEALRKQAAEVEKRSREWAERESEFAAAHTRSHGTSAAVQAELGVAQEALEAANKRARALEADNAELRRQKASAAADLRMLEELLADGDAERRCEGQGGGRACRGGGAVQPYH